MRELFIPYDEALALKELGFDEPCLCYYEDDKLRIFEQSEYDEILAYRESDCIKGIANCFVPLYQQAFRFFREKYKLFSSFHCPEYDIDTYEYRIYKIDNSEITSKEFKTYEEAELACLRKLIFKIFGK